MTDCSYVAFGYKNRHYFNPRDCYVFVNEVLESEKLQTFTFDHKSICERGTVNTFPKHQFEKHFLKSSPQPTKEDYIVDLEGRRYVNTTKRCLNDRYLADASVTIPRYLIVLKRNQFRRTRGIYKEKKLYKDNVSFLLFCVPTVVFSLFHLFKTNRI